MASTVLHREKFVLSLGIVRVLDEDYVDLPRRGPVLQMIITNLRNRPLSDGMLESMNTTFLSLYHCLVTGLKEFPYIELQGIFRAHQVSTPFALPNQNENTTPGPLMDVSAGVIVPPAGSSSSPPNILTTVIPEKMDLEALKADDRNYVYQIQYNGTTLIRVISPVYRSDGIEQTNRWRMTDYSVSGHIIMSVLCKFVKRSAQYAKSPIQEKRKNTEEDSSSSQSPPKKRLRL